MVWIAIVDGVPVVVPHYDMVEKFGLYSLNATGPTFPASQSYAPPLNFAQDLT